MSTEIDREDVLLLIFDAYDRLFHRAAFNGVTRLEKLVFLLAEEAGLKDIGQLFAFRAYKFGPYSKGVYDAAAFLQSADLVEVEVKPYYSYYLAEEEKELQRDIDTDDESGEPTPSGNEKLFTLTKNGKTLAGRLRSIWENEYPQTLANIDQIVGRYGSLPLNQIIRYVYRRYPKMAENSIHPEAKRLAQQP
jgi:hypothetical protein